MPSVREGAVLPHHEMLYDKGEKMRHHTFSKLYRAAIALFACLILACAAAVVAFYVAPKSSLAEADTRAAAHTYQSEGDFDIAETGGKVARPDTSSSGGGDPYDKIVKGLSESVLSGLKGNSGDIEIVIPEGVQAIAERAFKNASTNGGNAVYANITSVTIPNTVQYIGPEAFFGLSKLKTITFTEGGEESLTICGNGTYSGGSIASGSTTLSGAFSGCSAVTELVLPDRTKKIGSKAFENFRSLQSYTAPFAGGEAKAVAGADTLLNYVFGGSGTGMKSISSYYYSVDTSTSSSWGSNYMPLSLRTVKITGGKNFSDASSGVLSGAFNKLDMITSITLPEQIQTIHANTFADCTGLETFSLPSTVTTIYYSAFNGCDALQSIDLTNVKTLGDTSNGRIFYSCNKLTTVTMPTSSEFTRIPKEAFAECPALSSITIPTSVTNIDSQAFCNTSLKTITIPTAVATMGAGAFQGCKSLTELTISVDGAMTILPKNAFSGCTSLVNVQLGNKLTEIGESAFEGDSNITAVTLPTPLTTIGRHAFNSTALREIATPSNVTSIGDGAFQSCKSLHVVTLNDGLQKIEANAFNYCNSTAFVEITIPSSVTSIGDSAFYYCSGLGEVTFSGTNLTTIGTSAFSYTALRTVTLPSSITVLGNSAFYYCSSMTGADLSATKITELKENTFNACGSLSTLKLPTSGLTILGASSLSGCKALTSIDIPSSVTAIRASVFYNCSGLQSLSLPSSLETIGDSAFRGCSKITELTIPSTVNSFKEGATPTEVFRDCPLLKKVVFDCDFTQAISNYMFYRDYALENIEFKGTYQPRSIGTAALQETNIGEFTIPSSVTSIGDSAFYSCKKLQLLPAEGKYLPAGLTSLGQNVFYGCIALTEINIPVGITNLAYRLFYGCTALERVDFDDVSKIKSYAEGVFQNCASLGSIVLPDNIENLNINHLFDGCTNLSSVTYGTEPAEEGAIKLPSSIKSLGTYTFVNCKNITKAYWIESLTAIPAYTFSGCSILNEVVFPEEQTLTSVGDYAFNGCAEYLTFDFQKFANIDIGKYAFFGVKFTSLDLSAVKSIGEGAIGGNAELRELTVAYTGASVETRTGYSATLAYLFGRTTPQDYVSSSVNNRYTQFSVHYQQSETNTSVSTWGSYYVPVGLNTINLTGYNILADGSKILPVGAFDGFSNVHFINLPDGLSEVRDYAFANCQMLENLTVPASVEMFRSSATNIAHFFENCRGLKSLSIPFIGVTNVKNRTDLAVMFGVTDENNGMGSYTGLTKIELTNTDTLGSNAFRNARYLKTIILPENMTSIADGALAGCTDLEELTLPFLGLNEASSETATLATVFGGTVPANLTNLTLRGGNIGAGAFEGSHLESVTLPANLSAIPERAFKDCANLTQIGIQPDSKILTIGDYAFAGCNALSALSLSSSVTTIGAHAFENCVNLSEFTIPANAQKLGEYAFKGCIALDSVDLKNVVDMGARAFENCTALKDVTLSTALTKIEEGVFAGCTLLKSVKYTGGSGADVVLPAGVTEVGDYAFDRCSSIESVSLSTDLKTIGRYAFTDNAALRILIIPAGVKTISVNAFQNCSALEFIYLPDNANYGTNAFSNLPQSATLIASSKGVYDTIIKQSKLPKEQITYLIPITYHKIMQDGTDSTFVAEDRLYKRTFSYIKNSDWSWGEDGNITSVSRAMDGYDTTVWRISNKSNAAQATVESVNALLSGGTERIDLYAKFYATSDFTPKTLSGIVYGDVPVLELANARPADIVNYINSNLLNIDVDDDATILKSDILRVVGWQYTPVGGRTTKEPAAVGNAGSYQIELNLVSSLGKWQENIQINVNIDRKKIAADMDWAYSKPDADTGETELQYLNDFTGEIDGANKDFKNASVQGDGSTIAVGPDAVIMNEVPQTPSGKAIYTDFVPEKENYPNFGTKPGRHDTKIRLTFTERENYEFITTLPSDELTKRNLSIDINGTEGYVTITKIWYIIQWDNYTDDGQHEGGWTSGTITIDPPTITDEDGEEWTMPLRWTFGTSPNVSKPIVKNKGGDVLANPQITFAILSNSSASVAARATSQLVEFGYLDFEQWINKAVPAGEYTLTLHADQNVWGTALDKSYRFSVKAKTFDTSDLFKENGGEYEFKYDGSIKLPEVSLSVPEIADLRSGTGWEDEQFEDYYSTGYDITYSVNHSKFMTEDEIIEELGGMLVNVLRDDNNEVIAYDVYYRISAANYATVGGTTATYKFTIKVIPGDFQFKTEYYRPDWTEGEPASEEPVLTPLEAFDNGDFSYTIKYFTDEDCTEEYTESTFKVGKYYVKVYVPEASNWNAHESKYEFEVLPRAAIAPEPTIHRQAGLGSPNGFSLTTPATLNMRILTIVLIVVGIVILLAILLLIFILAWRAHKRRKELFERIMNITSKPISAYLPPQYGNGLPYTASAEAIAALPVTAGDVAAADEEDTDPDGFYDHFVSQEDIDAVFGKMTMPFGRNRAEETQQDTAAETAETAEPATDGNDAQNAGGEGNEE